MTLIEMLTAGVEMRPSSSTPSPYLGLCFSTHEGPAQPDRKWVKLAETQDYIDGIPQRFPGLTVWLSPLVFLENLVPLHTRIFSVTIPVGRTDRDDELVYGRLVTLGIAPHAIISSPTFVTPLWYLDSTLRFSGSNDMTERLLDLAVAAQQRLGGGRPARNLSEMMLPVPGSSVSLPGEAQIIRRDGFHVALPTKNIKPVTIEYLHGDPVDFEKLWQAFGEPKHQRSFAEEIYTQTRAGVLASR